MYVVGMLVFTVINLPRMKGEKETNYSKGFCYLYITDCMGMWNLSRLGVPH